MAKETATRIGINLTPADKIALRKVKRAFELSNGKMTTTAVIRILIRNASILQPETRKATAQAAQKGGK